MKTTHLHGANTGAHAFNDMASWWRAESGYQAGASWFISSPAGVPYSGPAVVDDFGKLVRVPYARPAGIARS